ncbi:MAG: CTP synthase [Bacillota bacterium]|nr:CTP synthase [Bacillota bacterium]
MSKYIFVTGGVVSGIGKGISAASIGRLLKDRGYSVFMQKFDPYLNVDPGLLSPYQHGEVFVTKDGAKTDLDLGHYERFIDVELTQKSSVTTGRIYDSVLKKEKRGDYNGATVQVIPHITDEIKNAVYSAQKQSQADIIITEIGGTVGDIESLPFLEAIRQIHSENESEDVLFIHTTLVPAVPGTTELKTKPTQHSYKELMSLGIKTDVIIARSDGLLTDDLKEKISLFCDVPVEAIVQSKNVDLIYEVPLSLEEQGLPNYIMKKLKLETKGEKAKVWDDMVTKYKNANLPLTIGIVGKYTELPDAYLSVMNSLKDAGYDSGYRVDIELIKSEELDQDNYKEILKGLDGIVIPNGSGKRGNDGLILAAQYARQENIPYLGIGLGFNISLIEVARNVLGYQGADSTQMDNNTKYPILDVVSPQNSFDPQGRERLGNYTCSLVEGTKAYSLYGVESVEERHYHRLEFNRAYEQAFAEAGIIVSGEEKDLNLVELIEHKDLDFYMACSFFPEYRNRPTNIHPIFKGFIKAATVFRSNK